MIKTYFTISINNTYRNLAAGMEEPKMEKKNIDWSNLGFAYMKTDYRYVSNFKDGAWDDGVLTQDDMVTISECAGVLQYSQSVFEGLKAYTTEDGHIVTFRPDLNAERMVNSAKRLEMPVFPADRFVDAVVQTVKANAAYVPPYGSGATLYIRPYMFGSNPVIGVKPADEYQFRVFTTPVGPYFKGGAKPITIRVSDFDRAAPHGTGHIKAGLNYAMSLHAIVDAHKQGYDENMYLDAATRTKVEETGGANFIFITKDNKLVTPKSNSILPSILLDPVVFRQIICGFVYAVCHIVCHVIHTVCHIIYSVINDPVAFRSIVDIAVLISDISVLRGLIRTIIGIISAAAGSCPQKYKRTGHKQQNLLHFFHKYISLSINVVSLLSAVLTAFIHRDFIFFAFLRSFSIARASI